MKKYVKLLLLILISASLLSGCDIFEKQEELDFTVEDTEAPVPGGGGELSFVYSSDPSATTISWTKAKDDVSGSGKLKYTVYNSFSTEIKTIDECEASGTMIGSGTNISSITSDQYHTSGNFNVVVEDEEGNKACYNMEGFTPD